MTNPLLEELEPNRRAGFVFQAYGGSAQSASLKAGKSKAWLTHYLTGYRRFNDRAFAEVLVALGGDVDKTREVQELALEAFEWKKASR